MDVLGILSFINDSRQLINEIRHQCENMKEVSKMCKSVDKFMGQVHANLKNLQEHHPSELTQNQKDNLKIMKEHFSGAQNKLQDVKQRTRPSRVPLVGITRKFMRANEVVGELEKLRSELNILQEKCMILDGPMNNQTPSTETYVPQYNLPDTIERSNLVLNLDEKSDTYESKLKKKVLSGAASVCAVGARVVAAHGMSGVGKTCAVVAVGKDKNVQEHFSGGVYFFEFGQNADDGSIVQQLANKVDQSGGRMLAKEIRDEKGISSAIDRARGWFSNQKCLFICDDMWRCEEESSGYLYTMKRLCSDINGGCVLLSTRDQQLWDEIGRSCCVEFRQRDMQTAESMLCKYIGITMEEVENAEESVRKSFEYVVERCGGLPVALGVAGKAIARIDECMNSTADKAKSVEVAIVQYKKELEKWSEYGEELVRRGYGQHGGLFTALRSSLTLADGSGNDERGGKLWELSRLYRGLCVLKKQAWAPVTMLACLWNVDEGGAGNVLDLMRRISVCKIEYRRVGNEQVKGVRIHDLMHDFCIMEARENDGITGWHERVVEGYRQRYIGSNEGVEVMGWWSERVADDLYIHSNLARHLARSGKMDELKKLLLDYRWMTRQLSVNRYLGIENDFYELLRYQQPGAEGKENNMLNSTQDLCSSLRANSSSVKLIRNANGRQMELILRVVCHSWSQVGVDIEDSDFRAFSFQLLGRLVNRKTSAKEFQQCVSSIQKWTRKPYVLLTEGSLGSAGESLHQVNIGHEAQSIATLPDENKVIVGVLSGEILLVDVRLPKIETRFSGHTDCVTSVAVSRDGQWMASASRDGTVRRWNVESGRDLGDPLVDHEGTVWSVAVSENGELIASGGEDGTIRLLDMRSGNPIGEALRGHDGGVRAVAISRDGQRVVSGSADRTVRVWDVANRRECMDPLLGHSGYVTSVTISRNNRWIVSGSWDETVRVWKMSSGEPVGQPLRGHRKHVFSVAVSDDCRTIVSGSRDRAVRVWDMTKENVARAVLRGHTWRVACVALSHDNRHVVSGSLDKTVRIWKTSVVGRATDLADKEEEKAHVTALTVSLDGRVVVTGSMGGTMQISYIETEEMREGALHGHEKRVRSIAFSIDSRYIVSGSDDRTVRIWGAMSGEQVGTSLRGHTGRVSAVAVSNDCKWIVSGSYDKTLRVWEVPSGKTLGNPLVGHTEGVTCVKISSDDRFVVSGSDDRTVLIWDIANEKTFVGPLRHGFEVSSVCMSRDNQQVVSTDLLNRVYVWRAATGQLLQCSLEKPRNAHLLWAAGYERNTDKEVKTNSSKTTFIVHDQHIFVHDPLAASKKLVTKVGHFDTRVRSWGIDANERLWCATYDGKLMISTIIKE